MRILLLSAIFFLQSCATGDAAVSKMTVEQQAFLENNVQLIQEGMVEEQLVGILGPVYRGGGTNRPMWLGPHQDKKSQIAVYLSDNEAYKVRWLQIGSFLWEKNLK